MRGYKCYPERGTWVSPTNVYKRSANRPWNPWECNNSYLLTSRILHISSKVKETGLNQSCFFPIPPRAINVPCIKLRVIMADIFMTSLFVANERFSFCCNSKKILDFYIFFKFQFLNQALDQNLPTKFLKMAWGQFHTSKYRDKISVYLQKAPKSR